MTIIRFFISLIALTLFFSALPGTAIQAQETRPPVESSRDFNISSIVLCNPDDPLCKPTFFFHTGKNIRINVLQNYSKSLVGEYRELKLLCYNPDREEILKAYKVDQFIWGPHINDKWLCFLPDSLDNGVYEIKIIVKVGVKEFQKSVSFSVKNPRAAADSPAPPMEK